MANRLQSGLMRPWIAPIRDPSLSTDMQQFVTWLQQSTNYLINQSSPNSISGSQSIGVSGDWPNQTINLAQNPVLTPLTVAKLPMPSASLTGALGFVTDATATTYGSIVAGGGSNKVKVYCNGTDWIIG